MSAPIAIRGSNSSSKSLYDLLEFPVSPPTFVMERHQAAFPSWPNRPSLSNPTSAPAGTSKETADYFSEVELLGGQSRVQQLRQPRLRRPSNYLELEFEDDSDDEDCSSGESNESTPYGSQQDNTNAPVKSTSSVPNRISALSSQLQKYKQSAPKDLRRKIRYTSAVCDD